MKSWLVISILLLLQGVVSAAPLGRATIYVENQDDDLLWVELYIDGTFRRGGYIAPGWRTYYSLYYFKLGSHPVKIRWRDPDLCDPVEKTEEINITSPEVTEITLSTELNTGECIRERVETSLSVFVSNEDDDDLWVDVLVDSTFKTFLIKSGATKYYGNYNLYPGSHTIRLRWLDPDVYDMKEKTWRVDLKGGEKASQTFHVDRDLGY